MYVYLCAGTSNPTHTNTNVKTYRESLSPPTSDSIECSYSSPRVKAETSVE